MGWAILGMEVRRFAVSLLRPRYYSTPRPHPAIDRMIRVDHAGEYGADRIYAGQMAVLGTHPSAGPVVKVCTILCCSKF